MAHLVVCRYCGASFDRDKEEAIKVSERRYAHKECAEKYEKGRSQDERDLEALEKYIKNLFNESHISAQIRKQIKDYREEYKFTYTGILKTLKYWYEIKKNPISTAKGNIWIVQYAYKDAMSYYYALYIAEERNKNKDIEKYRPKPVKIVIKSPKKEPLKKVKLFDLGEEQ